MDVLLWDHGLNDDAKEVPQGLKPEAEIARFTVEESLSDIERINLFFTGGQEVQQRKAIEGLPALLKAKGRAGWEAVRENLLLVLKQLDVEAQVCTADGLRMAVQQRVLPAADAAECLLPLAISSIKAKDKPEEEFEAWLLLLLELVPVVGSAQLLDQVLPLALSYGEVNEPVDSRVVCCRLLGAMTPHLAPSDVTGRFVAQLMAACQDTDYQVRITAAQQLPVLARVLGHTATVDQLLPELAELLTDDEVQVRMAALNGLVVLCELLPHEARVQHLLPLVRRHMQPLELELPLQRTLAAAFPRLLAAIQVDLKPSDAGLMYSCFRHLAARANVDLRRTCAQCVSELMGAPLPGSSPSYLHDTWTDLAMDHDDQVRVAITSQLHIMAKQVAPSDAARLLRRPLAALLRDSSPQVREGLLAGLAETLQALCNVDELHREVLAADVHQGLLVLQGNITGSWRCQQHLAAALPHLTGLLAPEVLAEHWAPYAFGLLLNGAAAVKPAAARALASLLRGCKRERARTDLYCRVMRELAWGRSCFARLAFTQLCVAALVVFSCRWFKEHLLLGVMDLLPDAVPNVRLAALGLLPALKQTIRLPEDVQHLEHLNSAMSNLMTDNDRDVAHAARNLHATFKRTPLRMTGGAGLLDINGSSSGAAAAEFEAADKAKEDGEAELTFAAEDLDRLSSEWAAVNADRKGRRNPALALADASSCSTSSPAGRLASCKGPASGTSSNSSSSTASKLFSSTAVTSPGYGSGSSISSAAALLGSGRTAASTGSNSSSSPASSAGWQGSGSSAYDRRFGSGAASSSNSASATGLSIRTPAAATTAAPGLSSMARTGTGRAGIGAGGSSSSLGSPRPGSLSSLNTSSSSNGPGGGSGFGPGSPLSSPTGSSLLANLRLPVLAGPSKPGSNSSSLQAGGPAGTGINAGSSTAALSGASRLGWSAGLGGSYQSSVASPTAAASGGRQAGALLAQASAASAGTRPAPTSTFGRPGDSSKFSSSSSSSRAGALQSKGSTGAFGSSAMTSSRSAGGKGTGAATASTPSQASRDAAARRFK